MDTHKNKKEREREKKKWYKTKERDSWLIKNRGRITEKTQSFCEKKHNFFFLLFGKNT